MGVDEVLISLHASSSSSSCKTNKEPGSDEASLSITSSQPNNVDSNNHYSTPPKISTISHQSDGTFISGVKRSREINDDQQQSVFVKYNSLSRKSKKKLEELLHHWSQWHAQECSISEDLNELLESGEETYYPALDVGVHKSSPVTFIRDCQVRKKQRNDTISFNSEAAPLYDREYAMMLTSVGGVSNSESLNIFEASRCFNCGSYNHSLKECSKPRDATAVKNAKQQYQAKKGHSSGPRVLTRYYQNTPGGKYDGLKPGVLAAETRQLLGLGELDPPPWLNRMREIGYPPGYYDLPEEDKLSGIEIYADVENGDQDEENLKQKDVKSVYKFTVEFPGMNALIPANADQTKWNPPPLKPMDQLENRSHSYSAFNNSLPPWIGGVPEYSLGINPTMPSYSTNYNYYPRLNNPLGPSLSYYSNVQRQSSYSFLPQLPPYSYRPPSF